jgi:hypothetical protein
MIRQAVTARFGDRFTFAHCVLLWSLPGGVIWLAQRRGIQPNPTETFAAPGFESPADGATLQSQNETY